MASASRAILTHRFLALRLGPIVQRHAACRLPFQAAPLADKAPAQLVEAERELPVAVAP
jgi:hypothetical protein